VLGVVQRLSPEVPVAAADEQRALVLKSAGQRGTALLMRYATCVLARL